VGDDKLRVGPPQPNEPDFKARGTSLQQAYTDPKAMITVPTIGELLDRYEAARMALSNAVGMKQWDDIDDWRGADWDGDDDWVGWEWKNGEWMHRPEIVQDRVEVDTLVFFHVFDNGHTSWLVLDKTKQEHHPGDEGG
jgi:hypothetical protein